MRRSGSTPRRKLSRRKLSTADSLLRESHSTLFGGAGEYAHPAIKHPWSKFVDVVKTAKHESFGGQTEHFAAEDRFGDGLAWVMGKEAMG